jgi:hypothetical protein
MSSRIPLMDLRQVALHGLCPRGLACDQNKDIHNIFCPHVKFQKSAIVIEQR